MLLSPLLCHESLAKLVAKRDQDGPHTALLAAPHGQVVCSASRSYEDEDLGESSTAGRQGATDGGVNGRGDGTGDDDGDADGHAASGDGVEGTNGDAEGEAEGEGDDEPWLDEPERLRLLLGLASQWNEDDSPRIECEVSGSAHQDVVLDPLRLLLPSRCRPSHRHSVGTS